MRNLEAGEICSEIYTAQKDIGERISHIVLMGIGEPLDNFDEVTSFWHYHLARGCQHGMRNISLPPAALCQRSTCWPRKAAAHPFGRAYAPNNEIRSGMMPVNDAYPVEVLMQAVRRYQDTTGRRVSFEYSMVRGVNDSMPAKQLANSSGAGAHVSNLIPINPVDGSPYSATDADVRRFNRSWKALASSSQAGLTPYEQISVACWPAAPGRNERESVK